MGSKKITLYAPDSMGGGTQSGRYFGDQFTTWDVEATLTLHDDGTYTLTEMHDDTN